MVWLRKTIPYIGICFICFSHVGHLGMDSSSVDPDLMKLLSRAGISEADMRDSETSQLIYDVIERSGGLEALEKELNQDGKVMNKCRFMSFFCVGKMTKGI